MRCRTANGWRNLTYGQLANAFAQGIALQPFFGNINTDSADLTDAKKAGVRSSSTTVSPTTLIPTANSINYYTRVANLDGGFAPSAGLRPVVPGRRDGSLQRGRDGAGHGRSESGRQCEQSSSSGAGAVILSRDQLGRERHRASDDHAQSADASASQLLCPYPQKPTYGGTGSIAAAASYTCK